MEIMLIIVLVLKRFSVLSVALSTVVYDTGINSRSAGLQVKQGVEIKLEGFNNTTNTQPPSHLEYYHPSKNYNVTLAYVNFRDYVAVYYDPKIIQGNATWVILHEFTSNAWSYMTQTYVHLLENGEKKGPFLYVILHEYDVAYGFLDDFKNPQYDLNPQYILNLGSLNPSAWSGDSKNINQELDKISNKIASLLEVTPKDRWLSPKRLGGRYLVWIDMVIYDLYKNVNNVTTALLDLDPERFKKEILRTKQDYIKDRSSFWFRDWFLPFYEKYGGNEVLKEYFKLRIKNLDISSDSKGLLLRQTLGEFVHIWCGVVRQNVLPSAVNIFEWGEADQTGFETARREYPQVSKLYTCTECNDDLGPTTEATESTKTTELEETTQKVRDKSESNTVVFAGVSGAVILLFLTAAAIAYKRKRKLGHAVVALESPITTVQNLTQNDEDVFDKDINLNRPKTGTEQATNKMLSPLVKGFEIPKDNIILVKDTMIGAGQFGRVIKGFVLLKTLEPLPVALKYLKPGTEKLQFDALIAEVNLMANLGNHENIVGLIGTYTGNIKNHEVYLALEFCPLGNLQDYLGNNRKHFEFRSQITPDLHTVPVPLSAKEGSSQYVFGDEVSAAAFASNKISTTDLLGWALNISSAMVYLSSKNVIHRDLATRNVLLTKNRTAKISDFGLSKDLPPPSDTYTMTSTPFLPWKWMAVESLTEHKFSTSSDVWAFGVTLWEIFSLSEEPYAGSTYNENFIRRLSNGERLLRPAYASQEVYKLMTECWKIEPSERPSFPQVHSVLADLINPRESYLLGLNETVQISSSYF